MKRRSTEEEDRTETHPGIVFRPGPSGRRAALAGGPDIWEICWAARQIGGGKQVAERLAEDLALSPAQVAVALRYAAEFPKEIEARIDLHERDTPTMRSSPTIDPTLVGLRDERAVARLDCGVDVPSSG